MKIRKYQAEDRKIWNDYVQKHTSFFFFNRDYLEYHKDRFEDHSLIIYNEKEIVALLPATIKNSELVCHGGLTFGFLIINETRYLPYKEVWNVLKSYCSENTIKSIVYKKPPQFFNLNSGDNDTYELMRLGGGLLKSELTSYINFSKYTYSKGRKSSVTKSLKQNLIFEHNSSNLNEFHQLLSEVLTKSHGISPVHSVTELAMLKDYFSDNIILSLVRIEGELLAGAVLFIFDDIIHTQYLSVSEKGKHLCAMDFLLHNIIELYKPTKRGLSFGLSTEDAGKKVNEGLILQKESYGASNYLVSTYHATP